MSLLHFGSAGQLPVITQNEAAECGLACLAMVASYHGHRVDLSTLRRRHPISLKGVTLRGMIQVATNLQFSCRALRFELRQIASMRLPVIAHWDMSHFVVVKTVTKRAIVVHDPASGEKRYSLKEASPFSGPVLEQCARLRACNPADPGAFGAARDFCPREPVLYADHH
jgi:ATP-binding cassette subfamily B protein RaxB